MINPGKWNKLKVVKFVDFGLFLDGGDEWGEILLPLKEIPENIEVDDEISVFIYFDSEDRIIATTIKPLTEVGHVAHLKVVAKSKFGAFLYWGLNKDLFLPFQEQGLSPEVGKFLFVYTYYDEKSSRIVCTTKVDKRIGNIVVDDAEGDKVTLLIYKKTDLGYKAIVNNRYFGVLYHNELLGKLNIGQIKKGYIKKIRDDKKVDLTLKKAKDDEINSTREKIKDLLNKSNGTISFSDKSSPEEIYKVFGVSKKIFKRALSSLYKEKVIEIKADKINLV